MKLPETLVTERLVIRRHRRADLAGFTAFLVHPTATRYMAFTPEQRTAAGARRLLDHVIASYDSPAPIVSLSLADPASDDYVGSCGAQPLGGGDGVEIYYTVLPEHQGRGLATEAAKALLDFVLDATAVERICAFVVPENVASRRVAEKLGFVDEGRVERQAAPGASAHQSMVATRFVLTRRRASEPNTRRETA
jgi:RimJ/RimL family protein N-acetyltransferase